MPRKPTTAKKKANPRHSTKTKATTTIQGHFENREPIHPYLPPSTTPSAITSPSSKLERLASLYNENKDDRPRGKPNNLTTAAMRLNILSRYSNGYSVEHIAIDLDLDPLIVSQHLEAALEVMTKYFSHPSAEHIFIRYAHSGYQKIHALQRLINLLEASMLPPTPNPDHPFTDEDHPSTPEFPNASGRQATAIIQAHKAAWAIETEVLERGIRMGVIQDKAAIHTKERLQRTPEDLRDGLKRRVFSLLSLLDQTDDKTARRFFRRRSSSPYPHTPILREPLRNEYGIIFGVRDWKYRKGTGTATGQYIPVSQRTQLHDPAITHTSPDDQVLLLD